MALEWGYSDTNGPDNWYKYCSNANGEKQSPIDISPVNLDLLKINKKLSWKYVPENTDYVVNTGYGWKVHVISEGSALEGGPLDGKYVLEQFHCHWGENDEEGSEHTIAGKRYSGELHLVHWNASKYSSFSEAASEPDGLCVLGILFTLGEANAELDKVVSKLEDIEYKDQHMNLGRPLDPAAFIPKDTGYYTYQGSLTTPPCSESVIWIVFKEPIEVSRKQLQSFRNLKTSCSNNEKGAAKECLKTNFRPTLPLGKRTILESTP